jgi:hypothetical protein
VLLSINFFIVQSAHIIRNTIAVLIADMNQFHSRHILFTSLWYTNWKSETVSKNKLIIFLLILEHYFEQEGEHRGNATMENGAAIPLAAKGMVRSHSISNDLHGVQPDPVAADILRKEPEQESFIKLLTAPHGMPFEYMPQSSELYAACLSYRKQQQ